MFKAFSTRLRICQQNDKKREREMSERRERGVFCVFVVLCFLEVQVRTRRREVRSG